MMTKTFDGQTARFLAAVVTCMPPLQSDVMQGWIDNPNALKRALVEGLCPPKVEGPKAYLRQLYIGEKIVIGPTNGTRTIAQADDVFVRELTSAFFKKYGTGGWSLVLDVPAQATEVTRVTVYEMIKDGTFAEICGQFRDELCLTQHQIINFCKKHADKLRQDEHETFFLFKCGGELFVSNVRVCSGGRLGADVRRFRDGHTWDAKHRYRFVFPRLGSLI